MSEADYFQRFNEGMQRAEAADVIGPSRLAFRAWGVNTPSEPVANGDTLLCACKFGAPCHRREAAPFLVRAGWRVILDGVEVT